MRRMPQVLDMQLRDAHAVGHTSTERSTTVRREPVKDRFW
jgi:hypothetical protein